jgi:hypothetical protein
VEDAAMMVYGEAGRSSASGRESSEEEMTVYDSSLAAAEAATELAAASGSDSASPGAAPESPLAGGVGPWSVVVEQSCQGGATAAAQSWKVYQPPSRWESGLDSPRRGVGGQEGQGGQQEGEVDSAV